MIVSAIVLPLFKGTGAFYAVLNVAWSLATLVPMLAVGVRRLHDVGKSGWYLLISLIPIVGAIILIVWYCTDGNANDNKYGQNPKYVH